MPTQKFRVKGLRAGDETSLKARVQSLPGVLFVYASHCGECVDVEFEDDAVTPAEITRTLADLGYAAEVAG